MGKPARHICVSRTIRLAIIMSQRTYTVTELAEKMHGCRHAQKKFEGQCACRVMVRRDIKAIELSGIPVMQNGARYSVDPHFMRRFI